MTVTIIIIVVILFAIGGLAERRRKKKADLAYQKYLKTLSQLNSICLKFGAPTQEPGQSFGKVSSALNELHPKISIQLENGELTKFRNKHELNEAYHDANELIDKALKEFVDWENLANPVVG